MHEKLQLPEMSMLEHSKRAWPSPVRSRENCTSAGQDRAFPHRTKSPSHQQPVAYEGSDKLVPVADDSPTLSGISCSVVLQVGSGSYARLFSCSQVRERRGKTRSKQELALSMCLENGFTSLLRLPSRMGRILCCTTSRAASEMKSPHSDDGPG